MAVVYFVFIKKQKIIFTRVTTKWYGAIFLFIFFLKKKRTLASILYTILKYRYMYLRNTHMGASRACDEAMAASMSVTRALLDPSLRLRRQFWLLGSWSPGQDPGKLGKSTEEHTAEGLPDLFKLEYIGPF
jgi:hypothetical protein